MISAHLNDGPMDDQYLVVDRYSFVVARPASRLSLLVEEGTDPFISIKEGRYEVRRTIDPPYDAVPHDLSGTVEFDWKGWSS